MLLIILNIIDYFINFSAYFRCVRGSDFYMKRIKIPSHCFISLYLKSIVEVVRIRQGLIFKLEYSVHILEFMYNVQVFQFIYSFPFIDPFKLPVFYPFLILIHLQYGQKKHY